MNSGGCCYVDAGGGLLGGSMYVLHLVFRCNELQKIKNKRKYELHAGLEPAASRLEVLRATIALAELLTI